MRSIRCCKLFKFFVLFISCACTESENRQIPPKTQTGENTFGCYVNWRLMLPDENEIRSSAFPYSRIYSIDVSKRSGDTIKIVINSELGRMRIYIYGVLNKGEGVYDIGVGGTSDLFSPQHNYVSLISSVFSGFYVSKANSGKIVMARVDTESSIYSGTFYVDLYNEEGVKVKVADGRFDVNLKTLNK